MPSSKHYNKNVLLFSKLYWSFLVSRFLTDTCFTRQYWCSFFRCAVIACVQDTCMSSPFVVCPSLRHEYWKIFLYACPLTL